MSISQEENIKNPNKLQGNRAHEEIMQTLQHAHTHITYLCKALHLVDDLRIMGDIASRDPVAYFLMWCLLRMGSALSIIQK